MLINENNNNNLYEINLQKTIDCCIKLPLFKNNIHALETYNNNIFYFNGSNKNTLYMINPQKKIQI